MMPLLDACYSDSQYLQSCDVCGRPAIIATELSGKLVGCGHCGGTFIAVEFPAGSPVLRRVTAKTHFNFVQKIFRIAASLLTAISDVVGESFGL
ncbi:MULTISPECIES: hypothetical protein [Rhodopirellula]|uniref:hypothetical protein n=1 Tax=Rhodopirellula TaxID=265488 RepID=UPI00257FB53C|nr:hypothetical protein [Rhodopirellula sp. UBA1907]